MKTLTIPTIIYPDSDGKRMADNTIQFGLLVMLHNGLEAMYADDANVFVAGDLLWYPVEGNNKITTATDVMVIFGRHKGDRGSYKQWEENNIPPKVAIEILSPSNTKIEMAKKALFYSQYGIEEYYVLDPYKPNLEVWVSNGMGLELIRGNHTEWTSKLMGISFIIDNGKFRFIYPNGKPFLSYSNLQKSKEQAYKRVESEKQRAEDEKQRAELAIEKNNRLAALLLSMGINPETGEKL